MRYIKAHERLSTTSGSASVRARPARSHETPELTSARATQYGKPISMKPNQRKSSSDDAMAGLEERARAASRADEPDTRE